MSDVVSAPQFAIYMPMSWAEPSTHDYLFAEPLGKLRDKYLSADHTLSLEFDLYAARRAAADPGWANRLEGADVTATVLMNSQAESWDVGAVMANRPAIEAALQAIPTNLALEDAQLGDPHLCGALQRLFAACRVDRVSVAKATKFLCLKRPRLIPMLDSFVLGPLYEKDESIPSSADPDAFAAEVIEAMCRFQKILRFPRIVGGTNLDGVRELTRQINSEIAQHLQARGVFEPRLILSPVRVLDNLIWFDWEGYRNFAGYVWDPDTRRVYKPGS